MLQKIVSLRQLGFSLDQIGRVLREPDRTLPQVLDLHLAEVRKHAAQAQSLCRTLESMTERLSADHRLDLDDLLQSIKETVMHEKYFTPEQVQQMKDRAAALGPNAQSDAERAWKQLAAEVRAELDRGTPTSALAVQALARRWRALIDDITGGDEGIRQGLVALHRAEPGVTANFFGHVVDDAVLKYISQAVAALPKS